MNDEAMDILREANPPNFPLNPKPGRRTLDDEQEFGTDGYWHDLGDILWRDEDGLIKGSW